MQNTAGIMRVKLRHLEVFSALFDAGSVSRAAQRLHLSQPAVSVALNNLEAELGFRLFHRDRGFFAPTTEAMLLHDDISHGIATLARIEQRATEIRSGATGGITIATNGAMSYNFLPRVIAAFQADYPDAHVEVRVHSSRRIASWVGSRQIDIGLIDAPVPVAGLDARSFAMECVCILREDDPLCAQEVLHPASLHGRAVIGITGDYSVDRQLQALMSQAEVALRYSATCYFYAIARDLVAAGGGLSIIDPVNGKVPLGDGVTWRPFAPKIVHDLVMITHRGPPLGLAAAGFHDLLHAELARHSITGPDDGTRPRP